LCLSVLILCANLSSPFCLFYVSFINLSIRLLKSLTLENLDA
jgi:hypothetical protein